MGADTESPDEGITGRWGLQRRRALPKVVGLTIVVDGLVGDVVVVVERRVEGDGWRRRFFELKKEQN